jgi:hypothetical protein
VAACAATGTDYVDLCGEPVWMRKMIDAHEAAAKASGAKKGLKIKKERRREPNKSTSKKLSCNFWLIISSLL